MSDKFQWDVKALNHQLQNIPVENYKINAVLEKNEKNGNRAWITFKKGTNVLW